MLHNPNCNVNPNSYIFPTLPLTMYQYVDLLLFIRLVISDRCWLHERRVKIIYAVAQAPSYLASISKIWHELATSVARVTAECHSTIQ